MLRARVIPVLLLRRRGLVKTLQFRKPRYVGDPINTVRLFNDKGADELILTDITATREGRAPNLELLEQIASEAFMPLCYGGGVRTLEEAARILRAGIEKISLNSVTMTDETLVRRMADSLGSQCVVASVDVKKTMFGRYEVISHSGKPVPEKDPLRWLNRLVALGAGEILLNCIDRDGTMLGYDVPFFQSLDGRVEVPIIACGGAGTLAHMKTMLAETRVSALGAGARFLYQGPHRAVLISYLDDRELADLYLARASGGAPS
jgi:imidazole glycerol-phosphate synthase subunit HisF